MSPAKPKAPAPLEIRYADPNTLTPDPNGNPNVMTPTEEARLERIIDTFGYVEPLVNNSKLGYLVGGHHRRAIAIRRGDQVPVVDRHLSLDQHRALAVALNNREAQGRFDPALLASYLAPIEETPLLEATGFNFDEWQRIQVAAADDRLKAGREGHVPPPTPRGQKTRTKPGELWQLGDHLLYVGNATEEDSYRYMPGPAQLCFTDPPYNVDVTGSTGDKLKIEGDDLPDAEYETLIREALLRTRDHLEGAIYLCHGTYALGAIWTAFDAAGYHRSSTIAWVKDHFVMGHGDYHWQWEALLYGWPRGQSHYFIDRRDQGNVWEYGTPKKGDRGRKGQGDVWRHPKPSASRDHPTMKPVALVEHALRNSSRPGDLILDPFGGAGSTMVACENMNRHSYTIELDPRYADVIVARWESLDGGKAEKA